MKKKYPGFTLIELVIVVAIIAILAAITIPALLRAKLAANEGNCVGSMKAIALAQTQFKNQLLVDQDRNGIGEFAGLGELTGHSLVRTVDKKSDPPFLSQSLRPTTADVYASKSGYLYQMFLPATSGPITDNGTVGPPLIVNIPAGVNDQAGVAAQENRWFCYAWPASYNVSGSRAFFISVDSNIYNIKNEASQYGGIVKKPEYRAIFQFSATPTPAEALLEGNYALDGPSNVINGGEAWAGQTH